MKLNRQEQKLSAVKDYIKKHNMVWSAGHTPLSSLPYSEKKKIFGEEFNTYGIEYYIDGFFEFPVGGDGYIGHTHLVDDTTTLIKQFDWRKRHGADDPESPYYGGTNGWMTDNVRQSGCWLDGVIRCDIGQNWNSSTQQPYIDAGGEWRSVGTCWTFSAIASVEALTNLYYNQHLDVDLSEQAVVSCSHGIAEPWDGGTALKYIKNSGAVDENCYPYIADDGDCDDVCNSPSERIKINSYSYHRYPDMGKVKKQLIEQGPIAGVHESHAVLVVGYDTIKIGDNISYIGGDTIDVSDSMYIGRTYFIFKQSNTYEGSSEYPEASHPGYIYILNKPRYTYPVFTPLTSLNYTDNDIKCYDKDNDGYYWWGIGEKPATCPACSPDDPDGGDSNADLGPLDENGYYIRINLPR